MAEHHRLRAERLARQRRQRDAADAFWPFVVAVLGVCGAVAFGFAQARALVLYGPNWLGGAGLLLGLCSVFGLVWGLREVMRAAPRAAGLRQVVRDREGSPVSIEMLGRATLYRTESGAWLIGFPRCAEAVRLSGRVDVELPEGS